MKVKVIYQSWNKKMKLIISQGKNHVNGLWTAE